MEEEPNELDMGDMIAEEGHAQVCQLLDSHQVEALNMVWQKAESDGLTVTYAGFYRQGSKRGSSVIQVPFVVAQTQEQQSRLDKEGVLEGKIYDLDRFANIIGGQDGHRISFVKTYDISSIDAETAENIRQYYAIFRPNRKPEIINPNAIIYEGEISEDGFYEGTWRFNSDTAELETSGEFKMRPTRSDEE